MSVNEIKFILSGQNNAGPAFDQVNGKIRESTSTLGMFATALGTIGVGLQLGNLATQMFQVTREFQTLRATLGTAVGGETAALAVFDRLREFAKTTPYDLQQVVEAFILLKNRALTPSMEALTAFGNIASGSGKSLNQLIEAVADAAVGETERLKEFGIKAKKQGEEITFTFRGVSTTVKNEASAIEGYLVKLGEVNFAGSMADKMETLDGAVSNFGDTWDNLLDSISQLGPDNAFTKAIETMTEGLDVLRRVIAETDTEKLNNLKIELKGIQEQIGAAQATPGLAWLYGGIDGLIKKEGELKEAIGEVEARLGASDAAFKKATGAVDENTAAVGKGTEAAKAGKAAADEAAKTAEKLAEKQAKAAEEARKMALEEAKLAVELEKIASNERIKNIELMVTLKTEQLKADTEVFKQIMGSITESITSTGDVLGSLFGAFTSADGYEQSYLKEMIEAENRRRDEALRLQKELTEAQIAAINARTEAMKSGEGLIKVALEGVEPELEMIMWKIIDRVQMRVNEQAAEFLIGVT